LSKRRKNKSSQSRNKASAESLNYKRRLFGAQKASPEQVIQILQDIKFNAANADSCFRILNEMLEHEPFLEGLRLLLMSNGEEIIFEPLGVRNDFSVDDNLYWITLILVKFTTHINDFVLSKRNVEKALFSESEEEFQNYMNNVETKFGSSVWSFSTRCSRAYFFDQDQELLTIRNSISEDLTDLCHSTLMNEIVISRASSTYEMYLKSLGRQSEDLKANGANSYNEYFNCISNFSPSTHFSEPEMIFSCFGLAKFCDMFNWFKRLLNYCALHGIAIPKSVKLSKIIAKHVQDPELHNFLFLNESNISIQKPILTISENENNIYQIFDMYLNENYEGVLSISELILEDSPGCSVIYEIVARSQLQTGKKIKCYSVVEQILACIANLFQKVDIEQSTKKLSKIFINLKQFDWSYHLKAHLLKFNDGEMTKVPYYYNFADSLFLKVNPFNLTALSKLTEENKVSIYNSADSLYGMSDFISVAWHGGKHYKAVIPKWRFVKLEADMAFGNTEYELAIKRYEILLRYENENFCRSETLSKIVSAYFFLEEYEKSLVLLAQYLLEDIEPSLFPLNSISNFIINNIKIDATKQLLESSAVILYFFNTKTSGPEVTQEISNICEKLLNLMGVSKLEELGFDSWDSVNMILSHVLNVEVIEGFLNFTDDDFEVFIARIKICQNLIRDVEKSINPNFYNYLLHEISSSFNKMVLYFCASDSSEGRVNVDRESLKVILLDELMDDYDSLPNLTDDDNELEFIEVENMKSHTISGSDYKLTLVDMLVTILDQYAMNKLYGLDNYLNVGIRHGEVTDHLWAPLKHYSIAGNRTDDSFKTNKIFEDYSLINKVKIQKYETTLEQFLLDLDITLKGFRNKCNVDTGELNDKESSFFNFEIQKDWVNMFFDAHKNKMSLGGLIDIAFDVMDQTTEKSLQLIREKHIEDLSNQIDLLYKTLNSQFCGAPRKLLQNIKLSKNMMDEQLKELRNWFDWADEPTSSFVLGAAFEKAKELINSLHPNIVFNEAPQLPFTELLDSKNFTPLVTVFSLIYENAVKHSGLENVELSEFVQVEGSSVKMRFTNTTKKTNILVVKNQIDSINDRLSGDVTDWASRDSGSGIFKVKSILDYKLKVQNNMWVSVNRETSFTVHIEIKNIADLYDENSDR